MSQRVNKSGRWTLEQIEFMRVNSGTMSLEEMSAQLEKNPITVKKYCMEHFGLSEDEKVATLARFDILKSPIYLDMKGQFSDDEIKTFLYHYENLSIQFHHDILSTERMQMVEFCRLEVLINRIMMKIKDIEVTLKDAKDQVDREKKLGPHKDQAKITQLELIISQMHASSPSLYREYKDILQHKVGIIKELKGSRVDRIKRIEDSKDTIQTWMAKIVGNTDLRRSLGIEMAKGRLAMMKELERLSEYYEFDDTSVELLITSEETLKEDNSEHV